MTPAAAAESTPPALSSTNLASLEMVPVGVAGEARRKQTPECYQALCDFLSSPSNYLPLSCLAKVHPPYTFPLIAPLEQINSCTQIRKLPMYEAARKKWAANLVYGGPVFNYYKEHSRISHSWPELKLDQVWVSHYERMLDEPFKLVWLFIAHPLSFSVLQARFFSTHPGPRAPRGQAEGLFRRDLAQYGPLPERGSVSQRSRPSPGVVRTT
jgi:hypothetical protein